MNGRIMRPDRGLGSLKRMSPPAVDGARRCLRQYFRSPPPPPHSHPLLLLLQTHLTIAVTHRTHAEGERTKVLDPIEYCTMTWIGE